MSDLPNHFLGLENDKKMMIIYQFIEKFNICSFTQRVNKKKSFQNVHDIKNK